MFPTKLTIFQQFKNAENTGTQMNKQIYPLFLIACFFYFYYDIILLNIKAG
jgi:hypothetical protein